MNQDFPELTAGRESRKTGGGFSGVDDLEHYLALARPYLEHYGYFAVFFTVGLESFGIPLPGQTVIIAGGLLAAQGEGMHIVPLVLTAWVAAVLGDNIGYAIGRFGGRRLILRHGARIGLREDHLVRVEGVFERYGGGIVAAARFFDVLRQLNGVVAGISGMHWLHFLLFNALGATLWVGVWGVGAYLLGQHMSVVLAVFHRYEPYVIGAGLTGLAILLVYLFQRRRR